MSLDIGIVWMSELGFFKYSGGQVQELPCEVSDFVFSNLNTSQQSKCCAVTNASFNEVFIFLPFIQMPQKMTAMLVGIGFQMLGQSAL